MSVQTLTTGTAWHGLEALEPRLLLSGADNFVDRTLLAGLLASDTGSNVGATTELGETPMEDAGGKSVWWKWTAPNTGVATINTRGSSFDTILGVFTGGAVDALDLVAYNDDVTGTLQSSVTFNAVGGTEYQIALDGYSGEDGNYVLNLSLTDIDLVAAIVNPKLPKVSPTTSGDGTTIVLPVVVTNQGQTATSSTQRFAISVWARPDDAVDDSEDVALEVVKAGSLSNLSIANLQPGKSKQFTASVRLPIGLDTDSYVLVAKIDSGQAILESDETNNEALTPAIQVTEGWVDLQTEIVKSSLLPSVVSDTPLKGKVQLSVTNGGNVKLPTGQAVDVTLLARPSGGGDDIVLATRRQSVSTLAAGKSRPVSLSVNRLEGLPEGEYDLVATVTPVVAFPEAEPNTDNNTDTWEDAIVSNDPFVDLTASLTAITMTTPTLAGDSGFATITVRNVGNVAAVGKIDLDLQLSEDDELGDDLFLNDLDGQSISLAPGASKTFKIAFTLPTDLETGDYYFIGQVFPEDPLAESGPASSDNDSGVSASSYHVQALFGLLEWTNAFVDGGEWVYRIGTSANEMTFTAAEEAVGLFPGIRITAVAPGALTISNLWYLDPFTGYYLAEWGIDDSMGTDDFGNIELDIDDLQVSPFMLQRGQTYTYQTSFTGQWTTEIDDMPVNIDVTGGTAMTTVKLLGYQMISTLDGPMAAAQISVVTTFTSPVEFSFEGQDYTGNVKITDSQTFWTVPTIGIIRNTAKTTIAASAAGMGSMSQSTGATLTLIDYTL